jgi:hypothetical protein
MPGGWLGSGFWGYHRGTGWPPLGDWETRRPGRARDPAASRPSGRREPWCTTRGCTRWTPELRRSGLLQIRGQIGSTSKKIKKNIICLVVCRPNIYQFWTEIDTDVTKRFHVRGKKQGCRSGLDPDLIGSVDPDPDPGGQKWPTKVEKKFKKLHVLKCWMASFESWRLLQ